MPSLCIVNVSHFVECVLVSRYGLHLHFPSNVIRIFSHVRWPFGYLFVKCFICSCLLPIFTILSFLFLICRNSLSHIYFLYLVAYLFTVLKVFLDEQSLNFKIVQFTLLKILPLQDHESILLHHILETLFFTFHIENYIQSTRN